MKNSKQILVIAILVIATCLIYLYLNKTIMINCEITNVQYIYNN